MTAETHDPYAIFCEESGAEMNKGFFVFRALAYTLSYNPPKLKETTND
jgi:hypothetical protein